jgi:hypothetical protein
MTIVDSSLDEHYRTDEKTLAMHFARILNDEARQLQDAGADVIQFDEPCFNIYLDKVQDWGIETLERCLEGITATKGVHICYGYGTGAVLTWKNANQDWGHYGVSLPLLAKSSIDQVSVRCAASASTSRCSPPARKRRCSWASSTWARRKSRRRRPSRTASAPPSPMSTRSTSSPAPTAAWCRAAAPRPPARCAPWPPVPPSSAKR